MSKRRLTKEQTLELKEVSDLISQAERAISRPPVGTDRIPGIPQEIILAQVGLALFIKEHGYMDGQGNRP